MRYNDALDGATENLNTTNAKLYAVQLSQHDLQAKVNKLEEENQELRRRDERLKSFEAKMPQITEYLNQFAAVAEYVNSHPNSTTSELMNTRDNKKLNRRLASVGMRMPTEPITLRRSLFTQDCYDSIVAHLPEASEEAWQEARASSHTAGRSANISNAPDHSSDFSSPVLSQSRKRVRPDTPNPDYHPPTSRDAMPPPTHYIPRKQSLRSTFQSVKKFGQSFSRGEPEDIQIRDNDQSHAGPSETIYSDLNMSMVEELPKDGPYMSGALPAGHFDDSASLPKAGSHMNFADSISHTEVPELELHDPRRDESRFFELSQGDCSPELLEFNSSNQGAVGGVLTIEPVMGSSMINGMPNGSCTALPIISTNRQSDRSSSRVASVVSPFFSNKRYDSRSQVYLQTRNSKTQASSPPSNAAFRSPNLRLAEPPSDWAIPHSLNGLSFFGAPVNARNELIDSRREYKRMEYVPLIDSPQENRRSRHIDSRGFVMRPGTVEKSSRHGAWYKSSERLPCQLAPLQQNHSLPHTSSPYAPLARHSHTRTPRLPSAAPSIVSGSSRPRLEVTRDWNLPGVRSSRPRHRSSGIGFVTPSRNVFMDPDRRGVRR